MTRELRDRIKSLSNLISEKEKELYNPSYSEEFPYPGQQALQHSVWGMQAEKSSLETKLFEASRSNFVLLVQWLIERGCNLTEPEQCDGFINFKVARQDEIMGNVRAYPDGTSAIAWVWEEFHY